MSVPTFQVPQIDYEAHPFYAGLSCELGPQERAETLSKFSATFSAIVAQQAAFRRYHATHPVEAPASSEVAELDRSGMLAIRMGKRDLSAIRKRVRPIERQLVAKRAGKAAEKRAVGACSLQVCHGDTPSPDYDFFVDVLARYEILELCRAHKGLPYRLKFVVLQHNTSDDAGLASICSFDDGTRAKSYYTHIDSPVDAMKVIVYLSPEVTPEGGAFRYYPGTHASWTPLELAIRKANDKCGWESVAQRATRAAFMSLPHDYRKKANFGNDVLDEELAAGVLAHEQIYDTSRGNLLLFDPDGAHRGAIFEVAAERKILQFSLVPQLR